MNQRSLKFFGASLIAVFMIVACSNRYLKASMDVDMAAVDQELSQIQSNVMAASDTNTQNAISTFMTMHSDPNSILFYASAPGSMGTIDSVFPIFGPPTLGNMLGTTNPISWVNAYFVTVPAADGYHGALIIAGNDQAGAAPAASPVPGATPSPGGSNDVFTVYFAAYTDGQNESPGYFTDDDFIIQVLQNGQNRFVLRSTDLSGGGLANVIQLNLSTLSADGSTETAFGKITMGQPQ